MVRGRILRAGLLAVGAVLGILAFACGGGAAAPTATTAPRAAATPTLAPTITPTASPAPSPTPLAVRAKPAGKITVGDTGIAFTNGFDIHGITGGGSWVVSRNMGVNVVCLECPEDLSQGGVPGLAPTWTISPDGLTWTFKLLPTAKFHNGAPVTAGDVAYSWQRSLEPKLNNSRAGEIKANIEAVQAVDNLTVVFKTKSPNPAWVGRIMDQMFPVPQKYAEEVGLEAFGKRPVAAGPWKFVDGVPGERATLEAFEEVYNPDRVPRIKTFEIRVIPERSTRTAALKTGEVDMIKDLTGPAIKEVGSDPNLRIVSVGVALAPSVVFDLREGKSYPWTDLRVRQAMNIAIDREAIAKKFYEGRARASASGYNPCTLGYSQAVDAPPPYDPARAKRLLAEAGYPNGFETAWHVDAASDVLQAVAGYWEAVGIKAKFDVLEGGAWIQRYSRKELDGLNVMYESCSDKLDPYHLYGHYGKGQFYSYNDTPPSEEIFTKLRDTVDQAARKELGTQLQKFFVEFLPRTIIVAPDYLFGVGPRVKDFRPQKGAGFFLRMEYTTLK